MSFLDEFQANIDSLPHILQKNYSLLRDLDQSLQEILKQNEQRCEKELEDMKQSIGAGSMTPETANIRFSDDAIDEQKHSIRIADEKVALAMQAYDLVDTHIQQLDQYLKKIEDVVRHERDNATTCSSSPEGSAKPGKPKEKGRGGRKKTRLTAGAMADPPAANPIGMEIDIPVDPNEPTYCFCNQVSYGDMVACDNPDCKIEWFHFGCVGMKEQPKGKWYCSDCAPLKGRRRGRS